LDNPSLIYPGQRIGIGGGGGMGGGSFFAPENFDMLEASMMQAADGVGLAAESASGIVDDMTTAVDTLASGIEGVFSRSYQLPVELVISGAGIIGQLVAAAVAANGGTVPGGSANTGRSGSGGRNSGSSGSARPVNTSNAIGGGI
jgi:hypothetical protein